MVWRRARAAILSPDPDYNAKLVDIEAALAEARASPGQVVTVYLDEVSVERQPTLACTWAARGGEQPKARLSHRSNTETRLVAALDVLTGRVVHRRANKIGLATLRQFYLDLRAAYPQAERLYVIQDNWPVHFHPDVLVALEPQCTGWPLRLPPSWPQAPSPAAVRRWGSLALPIQIVPLPTYASWLNPIEKLWRKLRQEVTHLHPWADDLDRLRAELDRFLEQFASGSVELLHYVGLWIPN